ncbi:DUF1028 domain-containing protein [bacterium]|nr:MAG: DUF1028 domain-containing protein [bacterium]MCL4231450.1 DUF1028 domain-containing protein [Dehalococcoidia bacterium]
MTFSIVAHDPQSGELGVGVATHQPCAGAVVPWVKAGVGAVATQSFTNPAYGPEGLALHKHAVAGGDFGLSCLCHCALVRFRMGAV